MVKTCKNCQNSFEITQKDQEFYSKMKVPAPTKCPQCRLIRRLHERNPKKLYYRKCDLTGKQMVSQYHDEVPFPVYSTEAWWGDGWEALDYGQDFDFNRPFFEQFIELKNKTPHLGLFVFAKDRMINSEFNNCAGDLKNCYLVAETDVAEDCYYSNLIKDCKNLVDCSICYGSELCYECIDCVSCYNLQYSQDCQNCNNSYFLFDCQGCSDCIGCINQRQKKYMIFNKQYTKEEYEKLKLEFNLDSVSGVEKLRRKTKEFFETQIHRNLQQEHCQNSLGDHLYNAKNSEYCFDCKDIEDCKYCLKLSKGAKSCMDYNSWGKNAELIYETTSSGENIYNLKFCTNCMINVNNSEYCDLCVGSSNLFGCVGLKKKEYCILNKQYSKEEYFNLKEKIIEHMKNPATAGQAREYGEFFPIEACPFAYNESLAMDTFPLTKEEAINKGFKWREDEKKTQPATYQIDDNKKEFPEKIVEEMLVCRDCSNNYKIINQELKFYRQMDIPLPTKCPECRHANRMKLRNPITLWDRKCDKCAAPIKTTISPKQPETVYCEPCYLKEVY